MRSAVACLAVAALLAGCAGGVRTASVESAAALGLQMDGHTAALGEPLTWHGSTLTFSAADSPRCAPDNCEVKRVLVPPLPEGRWTLQVALDWAPTHEASVGDNDLAYPGFNLTVRSPDGSILFEPGTKFGSSIRIADPAPGEYALAVQITHAYRHFSTVYWYVPGADLGPDADPAPTSAAYAGAVLLHAVSDPAPGPLLPDLVVRDIGSLRIEASAPGAGNFPGLPAGPTTPGCSPDESMETGAQRCLRFSVAVGNDGAGPFVVSEKGTQDASYQLGMRSVEAEQCVANADGSGSLRPAGTATYSASHGHVHYDRILRYQLFKHDPVSGARGAEVAKGAKLGYGPVAEALLHLGKRPAGPLALDVPCVGMTDPVGLNAGWYDYYLWWRTSQYVDILGVPDGEYELLVTFNPEQRILESDSSNDSGSVLLRLVGDRVEQLAPFAYEP